MEHNGKTAEQARFLFNRLWKRHRHLKKWARRIGTNAYRLYDRDIPEIPLVLDLYADAVSGALYRRPYEKDEKEEELWLRAMKDSISRALDLSEDNIFLKERRQMKNRQETGDQYSRTKGGSFYRDVFEDDLLYRVNLSDYLDTGLFLDARKRRAFVRREAPGKKVLNLFAYTCTLSAAAAKGGAASVDSVDLSSPYLEWGKVNFALNKLDISSQFSFIRDDVIQFLRQAEKERRRWDIIILDPPSFSNSKKMRSTLDIRRDYRELLGRCLSLLFPGGTLLFSSNARGFRLNNDDAQGLMAKDMNGEFTDEDFRGKRIPACYAIYKGGLA